MKLINKFLYILLKGIQLFFLIPLCMVSKRAFNKTWDTYFVEPLPKNLFNLCV